MACAQADGPRATRGPVGTVHSELSTAASVSTAYSPAPLPPRPLVSVVTAFYNREGRVRDSLMSVLDQSYDALEVIAVDDGSTDSTLEELRSIDDPRLRVMTHTNVGFVTSMRRAIDLARGELIAVHDSGDLSFRSRIELQVAAFLADPSVGVVGCGIENYHAVTGRTTIWPKTIVGTQLDWLLTRKAFSHGEVMYRKDLYQFVGGYRLPFRYAQDFDLWLRMCDYTRFHVVPQVLYRRIVFEDSVANDLEKRTIQNVLGELAVQAYWARKLGKPDLVDRHGSFALAFLGRSQMLAARHLSLAREAASRGDFQGATDLARLSLEQRYTLRGAVRLWWWRWLGRRQAEAAVGEVG